MATTTVSPTDEPGTIDQLDVLSSLTKKLHALLNMTHGSAGESFRCMSDALQDEYLWACADLASEAKTLVGSMEASHG